MPGRNAARSAAMRIFLSALLMLGFLFAPPCAARAQAAPATVTVVGARQLPPPTQKRIRSQARRHIAELNDFFDYEYNKPVRIFVAATQQEFQAETGADAPHWAVALAGGRKIYMGPRSSAEQRAFDTTLKHELAHVVLHDMFIRRPGALPRWLNEGLAVKVSGDWEMPDAWAASQRDLYAALREGQDLDFSEITNGFPAAEWKARIAYAQSAHFTEYLYDRFGEKRMNNFLKRLAAGEDFDKAFRAAMGRRFDRVQEHWRGKMQGKSAMGLLLLSFLHVDTIIWAVMALLVVLAFFRFLHKRYFRGSSDDGDNYDDDEEVDEWDYWDEDAMGHKPWRPGRD
jgi:hypothetical protein